jgi:hypothetical protein
MALKNLVDTSLWVLIHQHKYGEAVYPFTANTEPVDHNLLTEQLGIDYEPDRDETIELHRIENLESIPHIET